MVKRLPDNSDTLISLLCSIFIVGLRQVLFIVLSMFFRLGY